MTEPLTVKDWIVKRGRSDLTLVHSTGKITGIDSVQLINGFCVAFHRDGRAFDLSVSAPKKVRK